VPTAAETARPHAGALWLTDLTGLTDDAGNAWSYGWESAGRRLSANDPDLGAWSTTA